MDRLKIEMQRVANKLTELGYEEVQIEEHGLGAFLKITHKKMGLKFSVLSDDGYIMEGNAVKELPEGKKLGFNEIINILEGEINND